MKRSKKTWALLGVMAAIALSAVAAFAYWTTSGSGTGTASVASGNGNVTLSAVASTPLYPGGSSAVSFTADNPGTSNLFVGTIELESVTTAASGCNTADFTMADVASNTMVPAGGDDVALAGAGTLVYANTAVNQDACKGATLTLNLTSN